jgi:predicted thioesterase
VIPTAGRKAQRPGTTALACEKMPERWRGRETLLRSTREKLGELTMASERLTPGLTAEIETVVDEKLVVKHMGGEGVLSTPSMIALMERAAIQAVQPHLAEGHTTVGFEVNVKHFAATPKGQKVKVRAELLEVDGRKLRFKVEAHDADKKVGEGTHRRAIIQVQKKA